MTSFTDDPLTQNTLLGMEDNAEADGDKESSEYKEELAKKQEEEILAQSKDVSLLLQHSKLKKIAEARQVRILLN